MGMPRPPGPTWIPGPGEGLQNLDEHLAAFKEMDRKYMEWREALEEFAKGLKNQAREWFGNQPTPEEAKKAGPYIVKWKFGPVKLTGEVIEWILKSNATNDKEAWAALHKSIVSYKPKYFQMKKG